MWMNRQDSPTMEPTYNIPQEVNVTNMPCFSQRLPISSTSMPPSLLQATRSEESILTMMSTLKELSVYKTICKHGPPLHQYMNRKISMGYVFSPPPNTSWWLVFVIHL
jgi:hypothetical protein